VSALVGVAVGAVVTWVLTGDWYWSWFSALFIVSLAIFLVRRWTRRAGGPGQDLIG
jgi:membrane protein implicated in regulation of membrane protease activity